jgi:HPt (histidine-containing phosphotransfer) domain-containing protein
VDAFSLRGALELVDGDAALLAMLADSFIQSSAELRSRLEQALTSGEPLAVNRAAHALKGAAGIFVARPLTTAALSLEKSAAEGETASFQPLAEIVFLEMERLLAALRPLCSPAA